MLGSPLLREQRALELLLRPGVDYEPLCSLPAVGAPAPLDDDRLDAQVALQVDVQAKYAGYIERQRGEIERQRRSEQLALPGDLDYARVTGLSNEVRERLAAARPLTVGQAARLPGVTPAAVSLLLIHLKKHTRAA